MTGRRGQAPPRRDGAAQRPARPRPDPLGGGRARRRRRGQGRVRPQAAPDARSTTCPACAASCASARRSPSSRWSSARCREAQAAVRGRRACSASRPAPRSPARCCAAASRGAGGEAAPPRCSLAPALFALRGGELAAYHGVEHKAIAAYEPDAEDARRRRQGARPLRLAPRGAAARRQPGRHAAAAARARAAGRRWPAARVALASTAAAVEVFAWCERNADTPLARALRRPGLRAPARCSARASPTSASSRSAAPRWPRSCASRTARTRVQTLVRSQAPAHTGPMRVERPAWTSTLSTRSIVDATTKAVAAVPPGSSWDHDRGRHR